MATVKGKLTKGGVPLASVTVTFSPTTAGPSSGGLTDKDGNFVLISASGKAGAVTGKHKVVLSASAAAAAPVGMEAMMAARKGAEAGGKRGAPKQDAKTDLFPPEYGDPVKTPFEYEVVSGSNEFDLVIP